MQEALLPFVIIAAVTLFGMLPFATFSLIAPNRFDELASELVRKTVPALRKTLPYLAASVSGLLLAAGFGLSGSSPTNPGTLACLTVWLMLFGLALLLVHIVHGAFTSQPTHALDRRLRATFWGCFGALLGLTVLRFTLAA